MVDISCEALKKRAIKLFGNKTTPYATALVDAFLTMEIKSFDSENKEIIGSGKKVKLKEVPYLQRALILKKVLDVFEIIFEEKTTKRQQREYAGIVRSAREQIKFLQEVFPTDSTGASEDFQDLIEKDPDELLKLAERGQIKIKKAS